MRALVTGSDGFVAHHLIAHLRDNGDDVHGIDRERDVTDARSCRERLRVRFDPTSRITSPPSRTWESRGTTRASSRG